MSGDGSSGTDWRWRRCNRSPHALQPRSFTSQRARYHQRHRGLGITHTPEEDETGCWPPRTAMTSCTKHVSRGCPPPPLLPSWQKVSEGFWSQCWSAGGERICLRLFTDRQRVQHFFLKFPWTSSVREIISRHEWEHRIAVYLSRLFSRYSPTDIAMCTNVHGCPARTQGPSCCN